MQAQTKTLQTGHRRLLSFRIAIILFVAISSFVLYACKPSSGNPAMASNVPALPVLTVSNQAASTYQEFPASLEGTQVVEIRPQVDGYLDKIYVDEGAYVKKGQTLFHINDRPFREQLNNARANLAAAKANMSSAQINVNRIAPLVEKNVVSDIQLKSAQAALNAASAAVLQAEAVVQNAEINLGYTSIKSPVDGYVGRIPMKTGSLVGLGTAEPLTVVSEIKTVYAYFSLSETDFIRFGNQFPGNTIEEKIKHIPPVELVLADNTVYPEKGKVEIMSGQFTEGIGAISFRASFRNEKGLLRSGNTGRIRITRAVDGAILVPQEATFELQDKVFVFVVSDSNTVTSTPISIAGTAGNSYLVEKGLKSGQKIVHSGLDRLRDGMVIQPQPAQTDTVSRPL